jgi:predicted O-methyltransferase YrrM
VTVLHGDWHELMPPEAPFDLLFLDSGKQHPEVDGEHAVGLLSPGATIVMDDLTPERPGPDPVREFWLNHPQIAALEILTTPATAAIVGTVNGRPGKAGTAF